MSTLRDDDPYDDDDDIGTVRWFGESWQAPINDPRAQVELPTAQHCQHCRLPLYETDRGVGVPYLDSAAPIYLWWHLECWLEYITGCPAND